MRRSINSNPAEKRCDCGQLLAMVMEEGFEIKCRRCKRLTRISYEKMASFFSKDKEPLSSDPSRDRAGELDLCGFHIKEGN